MKINALCIAFFTEAWLLVICYWQCRNIIWIVQWNEPLSFLHFFFVWRSQSGGIPHPTEMSQMKYGEQNEICSNKVVVSYHLHAGLLFLGINEPIMFSLRRDKCCFWVLFSQTIVWMFAFGLRTYLDEEGRHYCNNIIALDRACDSYSLMCPQGGRLIWQNIPVAGGMNGKFRHYSGRRCLWDEPTKASVAAGDKKNAVGARK